jgi:hypothetical protein
MENSQTIAEPELTPFAAWQAGLLSTTEAASAVARELITVIDPQERAIIQRKVARRAELGTLLLSLGAPLEVGDRVARWVTPMETESVSLRQLKALIADLHAQAVPELDALARRIAGCISRGTRAGYPLIEAAPQKNREWRMQNAE